MGTQPSVQNSGPSNSPPLLTQAQIQSKLYKAIEKVIGTTQKDKLANLDSLHIHLKQERKRKATANKQVYNELQVCIMSQ